MFNLGSPGTVYKTLSSPLKYQTRCIACFPDATGYLVGRCAWRGWAGGREWMCAFLLGSGVIVVDGWVGGGLEHACMGSTHRLKPASPAPAPLRSVEGRVAVHHVEDTLQTKNFTFKCHRWVCVRGWQGGREAGRAAPAPAALAHPAVAGAGAPLPLFAETAAMCMQ